MSYTIDKTKFRFIGISDVGEHLYELKDKFSDIAKTENKRVKGKGPVDYKDIVHGRKNDGGTEPFTSSVIETKYIRGDGKVFPVNRVSVGGELQHTSGDKDVVAPANPTDKQKLEALLASFGVNINTETFDGVWFSFDRDGKFEQFGGTR